MPHGDGPRHHPELQALHLPPLGASSHSFLSSGGPLVTKTLLFFNQVQTRSDGPGFSATEFFMRAFDKQTGGARSQPVLQRMSCHRLERRADQWRSRRMGQAARQGHGRAASQCPAGHQQHASHGHVRRLYGCRAEIGHRSHVSKDCPCTLTAATRHETFGMSGDPKEIFEELDATLSDRWTSAGTHADDSRHHPCGSRTLLLASWPLDEIETWVESLTSRTTAPATPSSWPKANR